MKKGQRGESTSTTLRLLRARCAEGARLHRAQSKLEGSGPCPFASECAADGITANAVAPGSTETELFRANNAPGSEGEARYLALVPMKHFANLTLVVDGINARIHHVSSITLVPWRPVIDRQFGREVTSIVQSGSASWQLGRQRGLGL